MAIPVSCANMLIPVTGSIDMLLVPNGLGRAGFGVEEATTLFGYLAGMAQPLMMLATIPTLSLAASLVPAISEAFTLRQKEEIQRKTAAAFKICMLIVMPAAFGMWALAPQISVALYGTGKAAPVIAHLACLLYTSYKTGILRILYKVKKIKMCSAIWQCCSSKQKTFAESALFFSGKAVPFKIDGGRKFSWT